MICNTILNNGGTLVGLTLHLLTGRLEVVPSFINWEGVPDWTHGEEESR